MTKPNRKKRVYKGWGVVSGEDLVVAYPGTYYEAIRRGRVDNWMSPTQMKKHKSHAEWQRVTITFGG